MCLCSVISRRGTLCLTQRMERHTSFSTCAAAAGLLSAPTVPGTAPCLPTPSAVDLSASVVCRQQSQGLLPPGTAFDLFRGTAASARDEVETYPTQLAAKVTFGAKTHPEVRLALLPPA